MIRLFDLHCDTLLKLYYKNESFKENSLHISLNKSKAFSPYIQCMAIWSDSSLSDEEAFLNYKRVLSYAKQQEISFLKYDIFKKSAFLLAVEDARILCNDLSRLDRLYQDGVRLLTLNWQGKSIIGGAWDTNFGLSDFGKATLFRSFELGIIPDISHSSLEGSYDALCIANELKKPIIASHSNSFEICNHKRNLTNETFLEIVKLGGLVGISLASEHISKEKATINEIIKHIYHYLSLGGEDAISLGCDFDGVSSLPTGINDIRDLEKLFLALKRELGTRIANKIFFDNAYNFFNVNL